MTNSDTVCVLVYVAITSLHASVVQSPSSCIANVCMCLPPSIATACADDDTEIVQTVVMGSSIANELASCCTLHVVEQHT